MSCTASLLNKYKKHISLQWNSDIAPEQRVIFGVYQPANELKHLAILEEYRLATKEAGHNWYSFDLEPVFAKWMANQKYREEYFKSPEEIADKQTEFRNDIIINIRETLGENLSDPNGVVALYGTGALFGFVKIQQLIRGLAPEIQGRLFLFFPGTFQENNYRLLNAYDGWGYQAFVLNE